MFTKVNHIANRPGRTSARPLFSLQTVAALAMGALLEEQELTETSGDYSIDLGPDGFEGLRGVDLVIPQSPSDEARAQCVVSVTLIQQQWTDTHTAAGGHTVGNMVETELGDAESARFPGGEGEARISILFGRQIENEKASSFYPKSWTIAGVSGSDRTITHVHQLVRINVTIGVANLSVYLAAYGQGES